VRLIIFLFGLVLALKLSAAETLTMMDGASFTGDIVKFDDNGVLLRATGDVYTNLPWGRFSQDSLKQLSSNAKIKPLVEPFIEPDAATRPARAEIQVNPVERMKLPENPSLFGGLVGSSVGWFVLLLVYLANLYAAYEVSVIRARPAFQVIGLAAVLPIIGPVIFLAMPVRIEKPSENLEELVPAPTFTAGAPKEEIQIVEASWRDENKKKAEPQIFARGKFTFNKRFVETKFAGYIGEPKGDALKNTMHLKTGKGVFTVERIAQMGVTDMIVETVERGQVTVLFTDIQEVKLEPKPV
jgi:hypothetical protein